MKKSISILIVLVILGICVPVYADNAKRIAEVKEIGQQAVKNLNLYEVEIVKQRNTIVWANAIIGELTQQDQDKENAKLLEEAEATAKKAQEEAEDLKEDTK